MHYANTIVGIAFSTPTCESGGGKPKHFTLYLNLSLQLLHLSNLRNPFALAFYSHQPLVFFTDMVAFVCYDDAQFCIIGQH